LGKWITASGLQPKTLVSFILIKSALKGARDMVVIPCENLWKAKKLVVTLSAQRK
jgi:hypothetical protein